MGATTQHEQPAQAPARTEGPWPAITHALLFAAAYLAGCWFARLMPAMADTGITIWLPNGLLAATLMLAPRRHWPVWIALALACELLANTLWFHNPLLAALTINGGNALESLVAAWLVRRACGRAPRLETLREVLALALLAGCVAPLVGATVGSGTLAWSAGQPLVRSFVLWWIGDATGMLVVAPTVLVAWHGWHDRRNWSTARVAEAALLTATFGAVAALALGGHLPFAYLIMPPLLWAAVRFGMQGAVLALVLLTLMTGGFHAAGRNPFGNPLDLGPPSVMLQLLLAVSALCALSVAAIARQHRAALRALGELNASLLAQVRERTANLQASQERLRFLITNTADILCHTALREPLPLALPAEEQVRRMWHDLYVVEANESFAALHGWTDVSQVLGRPLREVVADADELMALHRRVVDAGHRLADGRVERTGAGGIQRVLQVAVVGQIEAGAVVAYHAYGRDVTERVQAERKLRESEAFTRQITDLAPAILYLYDLREHRNVWANQETFAALGYDARQLEQMAGALIERILHPEDLPGYRRHAQSLLALGDGVIASFEYRLRHADGHWVWLHSRDMVFRRDAAGAPVQIIGAALDITHAKEVEQALRDTDRRKDEFLATLAHELRNPLAPVLSATQILRMAGPQVPPAQRATAVIDRQVRAMSRLIEDLLDITRINQGKLALRRERVELAQVVQDALEASRPLIDEMGHQLALELPARPLALEADAQRLAQVFMNLLNNAAKYTDRGGRIELAAREESGGVRVSVRDNGIGIPPPLLPGLFEMFSQVEPARERTRGGLGVGLCLVRQLVQMHGGRVWADSQGPGTGSTFSVWLPLAPAADGAGAAGGAAPPALTCPSSA